MSIFKSLDRFLQGLLRYLCLALFIALGLMLLTNVFMRVGNDISIALDIRGYKGAGAFVKSLVLVKSMHWFDEIVELCFASLVFYGAAALWAVKGHFCVGDWISARLPGRALAALYKILVNLVSVAFLLIFLWYSLDLYMRTSELSTVFQIPKQVMYSCMPISALIMLAYSFVDVGKDVAALFGGSAGSGERVSQSM